MLDRYQSHNVKKIIVRCLIFIYNVWFRRCVRIFVPTMLSGDKGRKWLSTMSSGKEEKGGRASLVKKEEREEGSPSEKGRKKGRPPPLQKEEINSESYD